LFIVKEVEIRVTRGHQVTFISKDKKYKRKDNLILNDFLNFEIFKGFRSWFGLKLFIHKIFVSIHGKIVHLLVHLFFSKMVSFMH
jgi:hypothetical protein